MMERIRARAARRASGGGRTSQEFAVPLPLRGLFTRAKTAEMSNLYAAEMMNLRSNGLSLGMRPGVEWVSSPSQVLQRIPFEFAAAEGYVELQPGQAKFGLTTFIRSFNGQATTASISSNLIFADGLSMPFRFDGTTFHEGAWTTSTGVNQDQFDGVLAHHDRLFFWRTRGGDVEFYYGELGAVQGALTRFPLGRLGNVTGRIETMRSLTLDAGNNVNDVLAIFMTTGQILIYEGFDPGDADDWRLSVRVMAAPPMSGRTMTAVGSDVWMLTRQGIVSVADSVRSSVLAFVSDISQPVSSEIVALIEQGGTTWQMATAADGSMILINAIKDGAAKQFIYYLESKSWAMADIPAREFIGLGQELQITGFDGRLGTLKHGGSTEMITARWVTSWFRRGQMGGMHYLLPTILADGPLTIRVVLLSDLNGTGIDIAESEETVTIEPEEDEGGRVALSDVIQLDAVGQTFQLTIEVTAKWMELVSLQAA
jgi:hypothetical protein